MILKRSTVQLLRFPFSFFLMPVFWFALACTDHIDAARATLIFVILHLLVYPSSNGYNSYMDRDTDSIGGIEHPMEPEKQLLYVTIMMDVLALILGFFISSLFAGLLACYIICSRLYSYRGVRLKRFPVAGYITVILNQGGLVWVAVFTGASSGSQPVPWLAAAAACLLIGGFYPITQVYQHEADRRDGVQTISMLMGRRGTFVFCAVVYLAAFLLLFLYFQAAKKLLLFGILQIFFLPVLVYFIGWAAKVWKDGRLANFFHTMRMNWLASTCTNLGFITILIMRYFG